MELCEGCELGEWDPELHGPMARCLLYAGKEG